MHLRLVTAVLTLCLPSAVMAAPDYGYVDLDYVHLDAGAARDIDGFAINGSYPLHARVHVTAGYARLGRGGTRSRDLRAALGAHAAIAPMTHLVVRAGMLRNAFRAAPGAGTVRDHALLVQAGVRSRVLSNLEVSGFLNVADQNDYRTSLALGAVYQVAGSVALRGVADIGSDDARYQVGVRVSL